jgi:hypothetical protein
MMVRDYIDPAAVEAVEVHGWDPYAGILELPDDVALEQLATLEQVTYSTGAAI